MHSGSTNLASGAAGESRLRYFPTLPPGQQLPTEPVAIAEMAAIFRVTHRTLHFYEEKNLLQAGRNGARRVYDADQVRMMALVTFCRETGMTIAQIQELAAELRNSGSQAQSDAVLRQALEIRRRELTGAEALIRRQMELIGELLDHTSPASRGKHGHDGIRPPFLSEFEFDCLRLMSKGYTPVRIGDATRRDIGEVLSTEAAVIRKLGTANRFQAVAKAVLMGVIAG